MKFNKILLLVAIITISLDSFSQFTLTGEFRPRSELSHGYKHLAYEDQDASFFTSQRTRLNLHYQNDLFKTYLSLQDVRTWGNQSQLVTNEDFATSVHEAWAEVNLCPSWNLKAGRTELVYDDHRILGSVGWAQQARSHDLALLKYEGDYKIHLGLAYNENTDRINSIYDGPAYKSMQFLWLNGPLGCLDASFLFLNNGLENLTDGVDTKYSQTLGSHLKGSKDEFTGALNAYYQMGEDAGGSDIRAFEFGIDLGYKLDDNWKFIVGWETLSGTDEDETEDNNSFTPLYGTNHKFNGFMDYFYVGNHIGNVGLNDGYGKIAYSKNKFRAQLDLHYFGTAADVYRSGNGPAEKMDKYLGTEIDLTTTWSLGQGLSFQAGVSTMFGSETMEELKGGDKDSSNYWGWIMLTVKPTFFSNKNQ